MGRERGIVKPVELRDLACAGARYGFGVVGGVSRAEYGRSQVAAVISATVISGRRWKSEAESVVGLPQRLQT